MKPRILITPRSLTRDGHPSLDRLEKLGYVLVKSSPGKQPTEDELIHLVKGCVGYLAGVEPITASVLESATELRVISRNGTGTDNIDQEAATKAGIKICKTAGANARGVAELTIGLLLALSRSIPFSDHCLKNGTWQRRKGFEIEGKILGLVGCGKIGSLVAQMAVGMRMEVLAYDPAMVEAHDKNAGPKQVSLEELFEESDIISLHCPSQPDKKPIIDKTSLKKMKNGIYLINTARADLMDNEALLAGLDSGQIAGIALDVFEKEPPEDTRLVRNDKVITTPHIGGFTVESIDRAASEAVENLIDSLKTYSPSSM